ncbi:M23 family metallopeptidase [Actinokineospora cianjurensis]|uniref:LasA protease n=1 Tax=Actinokineospora cianjurensis TaxID=585224 RepID=A0A421B351_9PSEU|nr:M23 family metallopeptidase [Actinokineospora cianjurensis]RLK58809.1 LasA protease [Actinokineospora cianjurensis]
MTRPHRRRATAIALAAAAAAVAFVPFSAEAGQQAGLADSVTDTLLAERGPAVAEQRGVAAVARHAVVEPRREVSDWSFGAATIPGDAAAHAPDASLYVAHRVAGRWQVGVLGSDTFVALTRQAPDSVVSASEKGLFAQNHAAAGPGAAARSVETGLALPVTASSNVGWGGGPHANDGSGSLYSSLDFGGSGTEVRAAAAGKVYRACVDAGSNQTALILIVHANGYTTGYYHLNQRGNFPADGTSVDLGYSLGTAGTNTVCGGSANGAHVHFTLRSGDRNNLAFESVIGKTIGGWTFHTNGSNYDGYATHGNTKVQDGGTLYNYGRYTGNGPYAATVSSSNGANVRYNTNSSTSSTMYTAPNGRALALSCKTTGSAVNNNTTWYRLTDTDYVAASLISTTATIPNC